MCCAGDSQRHSTSSSSGESSSEPQPLLRVLPSSSLPSLSSSSSSLVRPLSASSSATLPWWWHETKLLLNLTVPTILVQLNATIPPAVTASHVGRDLDKSASYLDGYSLANIVFNLLSLSLLQGVLTASDTLSPRAFGMGNYSEVGRIAIRAYLTSLVIVLPINIVIFFRIQSILEWLHEDAASSHLATRWYQIYCLISLPFYIFYGVVWKFLSAQEIVMPLVYVSLLGWVLVLPISLRVLMPIMGFVGSAWAMLIYQVAQSILLVAYLSWKRPHTWGTWVGLFHREVWREVLRIGPMLSFVKLALGGVLATSEWWFWEVICTMVGTFGVIPLSVHTVPTQVLQVAFMIPLGIGIALSVRVGATLPLNVRRAKLIVAGCYVVGGSLMVVMSLLLYIHRLRMFHMFTNDEEVIEGCERIWLDVVFYFFNLSIYGFHMGTLTGLGMQWTLATVTVVHLWGIGLPMAYYFAVVRGGGLEAVWRTLYPPYVAMNIILCYAFATADWHVISAEIRKKEVSSKSGIDPREGLVLGYGSVEEALEEVTVHSTLIEEREYQRGISLREERKTGDMR